MSFPQPHPRPTQTSGDEAELISTEGLVIHCLSGWCQALGPAQAWTMTAGTWTTTHEAGRTALQWHSVGVVGEGPP